MEKLYKLVATVGEYKDPQTGVPKKRYQTIGAVFGDKLEDGTTRRSIKIDCLPLSKDWDGWANCYRPDDNERS